MALSASATNALKLATLWVGLAGFGTIAVMNLDLVRDALGINFEASDFAPREDRPDQPKSDYRRRAGRQAGSRLRRSRSAAHLGRQNRAS